jgi:hypothetical protein
VVVGPLGVPPRGTTPAVLGARGQLVIDPTQLMVTADLQVIQVREALPHDDAGISGTVETLDFTVIYGRGCHFMAHPQASQP